MPVKTITEDEAVLLIIEDEEDIRLLIKTVFQDAYKIIEAEDGVQGLSMAAEHVPNIIISDVMMPNMDGFEMCKHLKASVQTSHIPVIILTARTDQESKLQGLNLGAIDYINKPFLIQELKAKIDNLITQQNNVLKFLASKIIGQQNILIADTMADEFSSIDEQFLVKAKEVVSSNYRNKNFDVEEFARALYLSTQQLRRKIKAVTNLTVVEFVRIYRLQKAEAMMKSNAGSISEIAFAVGFESISYFSRVWQEHYSMSPSEYKNRLA
jgi:DNA-binding response OmpR family regulator